MSDSLISGQPLYLLYSKRKALDAVPALMLASLPTQATGRVRLQVTGSPPTMSGSLPSLFGGARGDPERQRGRQGALQQLSSSEDVRAHVRRNCRLDRSGY